MAESHYLVLARKWRPQTFESVVGQEHITRTLQNAITSGRIGHAFLFIGSRGIGKTTTARILAKALNCEKFDKPTPTPCGSCGNCRTITDGSSIDVIEIDGASNNSVEDVRQLRENIRLVPSRSRYRVYVIDEVHQLSPAAFNALLKTLEEPPEHAVFILATTEARKLPATIISRCQRYDFRRVSLDDISTLLRRILENEGVTCSDEALLAIARAAEGGIRDSESILEQLIAYCGKEITFRDVYDVLGLVDWQVMHTLCDALLEKDVVKQLHVVENVVAAGKDLSQFVEEILRYFRNLLVCRTADAKTLIALPAEDIAQLQARAAKFTVTELIRIVEQFAELTRDFDSQIAQRIAVEALLIRMSKVAVEVSVDSVLDKILKLGQGGFPRPGLMTAPAQLEREHSTEFATPSAQVKDERKTKQPLRGRVTLTETNMRDMWKSVVDAIRRESLSLGVWLGGVEPHGLDGDILLVRAPSDRKQAAQALESEENKVLVDAALSRLTDNVRTFRCAVLESKTKKPTSQAGAPSFVEGRVNPEQARAALKDSHIAKVIDVFKGKIVEIKHATRGRIEVGNDG